MLSRARGFTLIELVITMVLSVIVVSFMAQFISGPVQGYADQTRRAQLVDLADTALRRLTRDVRGALPNSLRIRANGPTFAVELLAADDGARYRDVPSPADDDSVLDFSAADDAFNAVSGFANVAKPFSSASHFLAIYNAGVPGADAYELANVITPAGTSIDIAASATPGEDRVSMSPAFRFAHGSPGKRVFLVSGPVTWLCDTATGLLSRYQGYAIAEDQADRDSAAELLAAGAAAARISERVTACDFRYTPGTAQRAGLLTASIAISDSGETVRLLHQVHTDNVP